MPSPFVAAGELELMPTASAYLFSDRSDGFHVQFARTLEFSVWRIFSGAIVPTGTCPWQEAAGKS
jgi:hypothetical protein